MVIIWIAPWVAIFLVDWALRRWRYVPRELQRTDRGSLYWSKGASTGRPSSPRSRVGRLRSLSFGPASSTRARSPGHRRWRRRLQRLHRVVAGGLVYCVLAWKSVRRQAVPQDALLAGQRRSSRSR